MARTPAPKSWPKFVLSAATQNEWRTAPYLRLTQPLAGVLFCSLLACYLSGCLPGCPGNSNSVAEPEPVLLTVNGENVGRALFLEQLHRIREELGDLPVLSRNAFVTIKQRVLQELVEETLLLQEARRLGVQVSENDLETELTRLHNDPSPAFRHKILRQHYQTEGDWRAAVRKSMLMLQTTNTLFPLATSIPEETIRAYWNDNKNEFVASGSVHLFQIVVSDKLKADEIFMKLRTHPERFSELAMENSIAPERDNGGDLGWVTRDEMPEAFLTAFRLADGEMGEPVHSPYGYHIFWLKEKRRDITVFEPFRGAIKLRIAQAAQNDEYREGLARMMAEAHIRINEGVLEGVEW